MDMNKFLYLKEAEQNRVNLEMTYVDMVGGDLLAGLLLSQIIFWFLPNQQGRDKTRATYKGRKAIAKNREDWFNEVRITPRQYDRAIKILQDLDIVLVVNSMFNGKRTPFIMLNEGTFLALYEKEICKCNKNLTEEIANDNLGITQSVSPKLPESNLGGTQSVRPLTETTTEIKEVIYTGEMEKNYNYSKESFLEDDNVPIEDKETTSLDVSEEALEVLNIFKKKSVYLDMYIKEYQKVREKYTREEIEVSIKNYNKYKEVIKETYLHNPENFFKDSIYLGFLDSKYAQTLVTVQENKKNVESKKTTYKKKSSRNKNEVESDSNLSEADFIFEGK